MNPIPVLYLIDRLAYGGTEGQLVQLIRNLPGEFAPCIGLLHSSPASDPVSPALLRELGVPSIRLGFAGFGKPGLFGAVWRLARFAREHRVRIVHAFFQDPHLMGAILKCLMEVKLIGSFRDTGFWRTALGAAKMRQSMRLWDGCIANSEAVKACAAGSFGIRASRIRVIYNGFDSRRGAMTGGGSLGEHGNGKTIGIVANLNRTVKRVEDFVAMASLVRAEEPDARFVVIGDGHLKEGLLQLSRRLGLDGSISFLGSLADPLPGIGGFGVGVNTSESEGFSNAVIEYLACGVPVVATNAGGNPEIVIHGENGFLVPVGAPSLMAEKVLFLMRNRSLAAEMGRAGRLKVLTEFSLEKMIDRHAAYYAEIARGGRST